MSATTKIKSDREISARETVELLWKQKKRDLLLIKCFDRMHNRGTIAAKSPEKAIKIILETLEIFIALAAYLQITNIEETLIQFCSSINKYRLLQTFYHSQLGSDPRLPSPVLQNETIQMKNLYLLELKQLAIPNAQNVS